MAQEIEQEIVAGSRPNDEFERRQITRTPTDNLCIVRTNVVLGGDNYRSERNTTVELLPEAGAWGLSQC